MNSADPDPTFTYETDAVPVEIWRSVMRVCHAYEKRLLDGQRIPPDDFASYHPELPEHVLRLELHRIHRELQAESAQDDRSTETDSPPPERYLILEEIRSGGMGHVFRAFDRTCGRLVALKRIRRELAHDPRMRRRFLAEVELTADLEHPGVIPVYDHAVDSEGREFYVMRLICGPGTGTLQQAIVRFHTRSADHPDSDIRPPDNRNWNSEKRAEFRRLIQSVLVITDTVAHAHSRGIAHRDLKPPNILVGPYGETLIADWGLAKRINLPETNPGNDQGDTRGDQPTDAPGDNLSRWSSHGHGVGTPGFRAPELHAGASSTNPVAADIYSLGAILDCVLTGSVRRRDDSASDKIRTNVPALIQPLFAIARKAMSNEAENRYPNAQSMRMDLSNWLAGEPVSAYPESLTERIWKWPRRHRVAASGIASAFMISLVGFACFAWFQRSQNEKLSRALDTTTVLLEENQKAKQSIEESFHQRESLALHAIIEFQSLLTLNPSLQSDLQFRTVREKILQESRSFYENLSKSFDQSEKTAASLARVTDAALALVLLENELGNFSAAVGIADSAYQRLRNFEARSHQLEYHRGQMLAFKGNIETRHRSKKQGKDDQEQAVRHLEPLLDSSELSAQDRKNATVAWSRAASPLAIGVAAEGDLQSAKALLRKILEKLTSFESDTFEDSLLRIQSYGNLGLVLYFSKDIEGTHKAINHAETAVSKCEELLDGSVHFREIVEFEVARSTLVRFKSDLLLTEGTIDPAIELQTKSLHQLTHAVTKYPGNIDLQNAYVGCLTRLQTVLVEHGRSAQANEIATAWLDLAQRIHQADIDNPNTQEFLLLACHTMGHLCDANGQIIQAQQHYHDALSNADSLLNSNTQNERLLGQALELNVHLIRCQLHAQDLPTANAHFKKAIQHATRLKSLPDKNDQYQNTIRNQMQAALRFLQNSDFKSESDQWLQQLQESDLLQ